MSVRAYRFVQVDVFTDRVFGGNPLAVVLDGLGLSDGEMQAIARENNLSETTFVLPTTRADCAARVRIFTPSRELRFAGHPTLGTAWVLATEGRLGVGPNIEERRGSAGVPRALGDWGPFRGPHAIDRLAPGTTRFALEEGIGPVPVTLEGDPARPTFVWMTHGEPTFGPELSQRGDIARALGLTEADLLAGAPVQSGSTGTGFVFVALRDRAAVDRIVVNGLALIAAKRPQPEHGVFVVAPDPDRTTRRVYSRMFVPDAGGAREDPATGSASGPLGAYLVRHGLVERGDEIAAAGDEIAAAGHEIAIVSEQGTAMGRQSFVHIRLTARGSRISDIRVGGGVVPVLDGTLRLP